MKESISEAMRNAVNDGVFPSAQLLVSKNGETIFHEAFGNATLDTIFDCASLTKPISTTTLIMQLCAEDKIRIDDPISRYLPRCQREDGEGITIRHLLNHSSGLPAWQPYYQTIPTDDIGKPAGKMEVIDAVCREPLAYKTGYQSIYSDIGFILLGEIIEAVTKNTLDKLFAEQVAKPLSLTNTFFIPLNTSTLKHLNTSFAPTEDCPWRHKVMRGEVHDQNCYAMGGVAGHAGLFSTTTDINKFITAFVESYKSGGFLPKETVERFLPFRHKLTECNSTWLLGWDRPSYTNSQAGQHFSPISIGHLGFTGCSMWIDLEKDIWIVMLTNRIHPTTINEKIRQFRPTIHNTIFEELFA